MRSASKMDGNRLQHVAIVGPTAGGKSDLALRCAGRLGSPGIFSMDAFQIYRGLDIGTAKPASGDRARTHHFLLDLADPLAPFSVGDYLEAARRQLAALKGGGVCLWVGGTGLYFRALSRGLPPIPATRPEVRAALAPLSLEEMVGEVRAVDPDWAARADLGNPRRVQRALAVYRQTGRPLSRWQQEEAVPVVPFARVIYLDGPDAWLRERIRRRLAQMWDSGWLEEVRALCRIPGWRESPSARAIGYAEIADFLEGGPVRDPQHCREEIETRTWQYARRQRTWFRKEPGCIVLDPQDPDQACETILAGL